MAESRKNKTEEKKIVVTREMKRNLVIGLLIAIVLILMLSFSSMLLTKEITNPEIMSAEEYRAMCNEVHKKVFHITDGQRELLIEEFEIPSPKTIVVEKIRKEELVLKLMTDRRPILIAFRYEEEKVGGRYNEKDLNLFYSIEEEMLFLQFVEEGEVMEFRLE